MSIKCIHSCPKCKTPCNKTGGHAEAGFDGIAGLCWCDKGHGWWVAGETTMLDARATVAPPQDTGITIIGIPVEVNATLPKDFFALVSSGPKAYVLVDDMQTARRLTAACNMAVATACEHCGGLGPLRKGAHPTDHGKCAHGPAKAAR